jgi:hypothetical protein
VADHSIPPTHFVLAVVFGLPQDLDAGVEDLRKRIIGTRDCRTSVQIVSTFDYDASSSVATFLLSRARAQKFINMGYEVALLSTMFWRIQSKKVRCASMECVGDLDEWDKTRVVASSKGRDLTKREMQGWEDDVMRGCFGENPAMGMGNPMMNMLGPMGGMLGIGGPPPEFADMLQGIFGISG